LTSPIAPLETHDPERARVLKVKIMDRMKDVRRHLAALRSAMAKFGEDFDRDLFVTAYDSSDPDELNMVKAVERGVDQLYNYMADLAAFGLELAEVRARTDELNARRDFEALRRTKVLSAERVAELQQLREIRRLMVHDYANATAAQVHEAALVVSGVLPTFFNAFREWIKTGFVVSPAA
jgi:uncharacterized protein YutE (UPF0331/DUF86 family)